MRQKKGHIPSVSATDAKMGLAEDVSTSAAMTTLPGDAQLFRAMPGGKLLRLKMKRKWKGEGSRGTWRLDQPLLGFRLKEDKIQKGIWVLWPKRGRGIGVFL